MAYKMSPHIADLAASFEVSSAVVGAAGDPQNSSAHVLGAATKATRLHVGKPTQTAADNTQTACIITGASPTDLAAAALGQTKLYLAKAQATRNKGHNSTFLEQMEAIIALSESALRSAQRGSLPINALNDLRRTASGLTNPSIQNTVNEVLKAAANDAALPGATAANLMASVAFTGTNLRKELEKGPPADAAGLIQKIVNGVKIGRKVGIAGCGVTFLIGMGVLGPTIIGVVNSIKSLDPGQQAIKIPGKSIDRYLPMPESTTPVTQMPSGASGSDNITDANNNKVRATIYNAPQEKQTLTVSDNAYITSNVSGATINCTDDCKVLKIQGDVQDSMIRMPPGGKIVIVGSVVHSVLTVDPSSGSPGKIDIEGTVGNSSTLTAPNITVNGKASDSTFQGTYYIKEIGPGNGFIGTRVYSPIAMLPPSSKKHYKTLSA